MPVPGKMYGAFAPRGNYITEIFLSHLHCARKCCEERKVRRHWHRTWFVWQIMQVSNPLCFGRLLRQRTARSDINVCYTTAP
jgi:hypothetical protein